MTKGPWLESLSSPEMRLFLRDRRILDESKCFQAVPIAAGVRYINAAP